MELEKIGYSQATAVDWAGLTDKIAKGISNIGIAKAKSDEETNKIYEDTIKKLNEPQGLDNNTLTSFVLDGSKKYKDYALQLHNKWKAGEITSNDVKKRLSNAQEHWVDFANQTKDVDARYKLFVDRNTPDENGMTEASDAESYLYSVYADMANIKDKTPVIGEDGTIYMQKPDGSLIDFRDLSKPENIQIDKLDLNAAVDGITSNWAAVDKYEMFGRGGEKTTTSVKLQKDYELMKINAADALVSNPKTALSVLVDNGVIDNPIYYSSDSQKEYDLKKLIAETKAKYEAVGKEFTADDEKRLEQSFIKFQKDDNGILMPALTQDQINLAKDRVGKSIDMSIETKINASAPPVYAPNYGNGNGNDTDTKEDPLSSTFATIVNSWGKPGGADVLTNLSGGKFTFKPAKGGGYDVIDENGKTFSTVHIKNLRAAAPLLGFGTGTGAEGTTGAVEEFDRQKKAYYNATKGGKVNKPTTKDPLGLGI